MEMKCEILGDNSKFNDVVDVRVPGIYVTKGNPLPQRMSKLVRPAAIALQKVYKDIVAEGGHLYISDMFRSATEQQKAHEDWKSGRKTAYSPPSCSSVHEAARAIDIDAFDTGIGHKRVREILKDNGWTNIVNTLTGPECWHYEFREQKWEDYRKQHSAEEMAHAMKEEIGNLIGVKKAESAKEDVKWLQESLNKLLGTKLTPDGIYGEKTKETVMDFQRKYKLQVDGVAGPITIKKIKELLGGD